jgi:hypothetical protein
VSFCEYHQIRSKKIGRYYLIRFDSICLDPIFTGLQTPPDLSLTSGTETMCVYIDDRLDLLEEPDT